MSVSQLWLQLVGQIRWSSIHHVDTGGISVCVTACVGTQRRDTGKRLREKTKLRNRKQQMLFSINMKIIWWEALDTLSVCVCK